MHLIVIIFSDNVVHLVVPTTIKTENMDPETKIEVYKRLLMLNDRLHIMKYIIG